MAGVAKLVTEIAMQRLIKIIVIWR